MMSQPVFQWRLKDHENKSYRPYGQVSTRVSMEVEGSKIIK